MYLLLLLLLSSNWKWKKKTNKDTTYKWECIRSLTLSLLILIIIIFIKYKFSFLMYILVYVHRSRYYIRLSHNLRIYIYFNSKKIYKIYTSSSSSLFHLNGRTILNNASSSWRFKECRLVEYCINKYARVLFVYHIQAARRHIRKDRRTTNDEWKWITLVWILYYRLINLNIYIICISGQLTEPRLPTTNNQQQ